MRDRSENGWDDGNFACVDSRGREAAVQIFRQERAAAGINYCRKISVTASDSVIDNAPLLPRSRSGGGEFCGAFDGDAGGGDGGGDLGEVRAERGVCDGGAGGEYDGERGGYTGLVVFFALDVCFR